MKWLHKEDYDKERERSAVKEKDDTRMTRRPTAETACPERGHVIRKIQEN
jgi:hypothetical protein